MIMFVMLLYPNTSCQGGQRQGHTLHKQMWLAVDLSFNSLFASLCNTSNAGVGGMVMLSRTRAELCLHLA
jgi:hypothetical protein